MIALYALLLQAFLGTLVPVAFAAPGAEALCAQDGSGAPHDDGAACREHACCLPIHAEQLKPPPAPHAVAASAWPPTPAARVVWSAADAVLPRPPPDPSASPRGPPAV